MKIRMGFVSNSSSSSYTCDLCGVTASGWDIDLAECGLVQCENGHTYCRDHAENWNKQSDISREEKIKRIIGGEGTNPETDDPFTEFELLQMNAEELNDAYEAFLEDVEDGSDELPAEKCYICQMQALPDREMFVYLMQKLGLSRESITEEARSTFGSYEKFKEFIKKQKIIAPSDM